MTSEISRPHRARLFVAIALALVLPAAPAVARNLMPGDSATVLNTPIGGEEAWKLYSATLAVAPRGRTLAIEAYHSAVGVDTGVVSSATGDAIRIHNGTTLTMTNAQVASTNGVGLHMSNDGGSTGGPGADLVTRADVSASHISGTTFGASIANASELTLDAGSTVTGTNGTGLRLSDGTVNLKGNSTITGTTNGILILGENRFGDNAPSGRHVVIDASTVQGGTGSAILVSPRDPTLNTSDFVLTNGSTLIGGNGVSVEANGAVSTSVTASDSNLIGGVAATGGAHVGLNLLAGSTLVGNFDATTGSIDATIDGGVMQGSTQGAVTMALANGGAWTMTGDSSVNALILDGGGVTLGDGSVARALIVHGDVSGTGGRVNLHTHLNEGGALGAQHTDRLLVEGNVATTGSTEIVVTPTGSGALTDTNQNGTVEANEGISLVQVAGSSRADAFTLRGGYVAAGPWQYTLHAFGPGEADQAQNALATGALNWDYRLGNRYVCETDCEPVDPTKPVDPGDPGDPVNPGDPGNPVDPVTPPENGRVAVVPQLPSYLSAPAALLTYGDMMNDGLHQRLGDLRNGSSHDPVGGEVFARYLGGQLRYSSNLSFQNYGYDFDQQVNALQLGGSLIALDGDNGSLRAGWAVDHGTTRVTPKAADGNSSAKYNANGISGWITWLHGSGLWVDGVLGSTRYHGDVGTDLRGADVGRVHANGWTMSVETGMPFALGNDWTIEPRFQLKHQQLNFRDFTDDDGLDVRLGTAKQTSATLGGRIMRTANPVFMPYANLDLTHTSNGDPNADVSNTDWDVSQRFGSGRVGNAYRVAAGAVSQLGEHVQIYGEGTYQHFVGSYGMQGWAGNVGIRVSF
ncbi:MAG TPA: autotransporter outer membrane beta-barrel domain-containing protein [Luteibacter sp.]|uniref:autotransporter family protein n=1 Tax=Luteibacter sp. TaxID=1886636 RepID=UPI002B9CC1E4|nr:autotransporter outer membrane beta-barrel domain-containing protein [Luteibacter sp.]HVI53532.1 autotransporter outer membrane beta-barrel domain-containing protein [Luteibacter sp.]